MPSDLRSNDKQQNRLRTDFSLYPNIFYSGGRRQEKKPRNKIIFEPYLVAQTIEAFHGDCVIAYNEKKALWSDDKKYVNVFTDSLTVEHIIFLYSLERSISEFKRKLIDKGSDRSDNDNRNLSLLKKRGSKMLLIFIISQCMETILGGKKIINTWRLRFKVNDDFEALVLSWECVIKSILPLSKKAMENALRDGLHSIKDAKEASEDVFSNVAAIQDVLLEQMDKFISKVECEPMKKLF